MAPLLAVIFFPLAIVLMTRPTYIASELLIRKCCPEWQELNLTNLTCINRPGFFGNESWGSATQRFVSDVIDSGSDGSQVLWWVSNRSNPLNPETLNPTGSLLEGQNASKYIEYGVMPSCDRFMTMVKPAKKFDLLHNGSIIYHVPETGQNFTFSPNAYCADIFRNRDKVVEGYFVCACLETLCLKKCCPVDRYITLTPSRYRDNYNCNNKLNEFENKPYWNPGIHDDNLTEISPKPAFVTFHNAFVCPKDRTPLSIQLQNPGEFWWFSNGSVLVKTIGNGIPFDSQHACGDLGVVNDNKTLVENLMVCGEFIKDRDISPKSHFYISLYVIGIIFMVLTLVVFGLVPDIRRNNTSFIVCHILILIVGYFVLLITNIFTRVPPSLCVILPFIIQFSFLAAFFWLNVMCIDISWAFSGFRPPQGSVTERDRKKFIYYSVYAWGSPTLIFIVTAIMEFVQEIPATYLKPDFGIRSCWFKEKSAAFAYFYGPMAVLLLVNFALFLYTTIKIIQVQRDTRILHHGDSSRHEGSNSSNFKKDKKRLILYAKLFCLMGLTWITEIISWLHGSQEYYYYVTDAINLLRAVFIFIIFCCKRKVFRLLKQRLFPSLALKNTASQSNGTRKSSSSTQNSSLPPIQMTSIKTPKVEMKPSENV